MEDDLGLPVTIPYKGVGSSLRLVLQGSFRIILGELSLPERSITQCNRTLIGGLSSVRFRSKA